MAAETVPPGTRPRPEDGLERLFEWPLPQRFSRLISELRGVLDAQVTSAQRGLDHVVQRKVWLPITRTVQSLIDGTMTAHDFHPIHRWYVAQSLSWVAYYDARYRTLGVTYTREQIRRFEPWVTVARTCGWWWPREDVCVVAERPAVVSTEPADENGQVRLHCPDGPAMRYPDGWEVYAWHGTPVPRWVMTDPNADRIARETNVEVRRCAIERIGWETYFEQAGLWPIATCSDPGNPGAELHLYDTPGQARVLLTVNGSVERDGHRRRYGLTVPAHFKDPLAAAGWTYGLSAEQYSLLARRT